VSSEPRLLEPWFEAIADALPIVLYSVDLEGKLTWWNRCLELAVGRTSSDLLHEPMLGLFAEGDQASAQEAIQEAVATGRAEGEWDLITPSGSDPHHFLYLAIRDTNGDIVGAAACGQDLSDRRPGEEAGRRWAELSQGFLNTMSDLGQGVAIVQDGRFVYVNDALSQITGYTRDELLTLPSFLALLAPEARLVAEEHMRDRRNGSPPIDHTEVVGMHKDGRRIYAEFSAKPISLGGPRQHFTIIRDITERKRAEHSARREAAFVKLLQSVAVVANGADSEEEALQFTVDRVCAHTGWPIGHVYIRDEASGDFVSSGIWSSETSVAFHEFRQATEAARFGPSAGLPGWVVATSEAAWIADVTRQPGFGRARQAQQTGVRAGFAFPVLVGSEVVAVLEFFSTEVEEPDERLLDVMAHIGTQLGRVIERKRAERQFLQRKETDALTQPNVVERLQHDLELARRDVEQFAYVASHDLQEPLRMVSCYLQLLADRYQGQLDRDADDFIHFAIDGAQRMQALMDGLLAYSRLGSHAGVFRPTDFSRVLERALGGLRGQLEGAGATVTSDELPTLMADESQIDLLLQNLLSNSVKFCGDRRPRVHVSGREEDCEWVFSVRDNGIGIDQQYAERVFLIFQRLHSRAEYPGTGVGLSICKRIVDRHGGRIWFESEPGGGATFFFTMPKGSDERTVRGG
jgi:PAS domain S-box-containing protein